MSKCINTGSEHGSEKWLSEPSCRCATCRMYDEYRSKRDAVTAERERVLHIIEDEVLRRDHPEAHNALNLVAIRIRKGTP